MSIFNEETYFAPNTENLKFFLYLLGTYGHRKFVDAIPIDNSRYPYGVHYQNKELEKWAEIVSNRLVKELENI